MSATAPKTINPRAVAFGRQLRAEMLDQNVSSRELGRRLAKSGTITAPAARRSVMKYLAGDVLPSPERRDELADALGVGRERLELDEDEESDLFMTLYSALQAIARHEIRRELDRAARA